LTSEDYYNGENGTGLNYVLIEYKNNIIYAGNGGSELKTCGKNFLVCNTIESANSRFNSVSERKLVIVSSTSLDKSTTIDSSVTINSSTTSQSTINYATNAIGSNGGIVNSNGVSLTFNNIKLGLSSVSTTSTGSAVLSSGSSLNLNSVTFEFPSGKTLNYKLINVNGGTASLNGLTISTSSVATFSGAPLSLTTTGDVNIGSSNIKKIKINDEGILFDVNKLSIEGCAFDNIVSTGTTGSVIIFESGTGKSLCICGEMKFINCKSTGSNSKGGVMNVKIIK